MGQRESKNYNGQYNGKKITVHIKRLAAFGLTIILMKNGYSCVSNKINTNQNDETTEKFVTLEDRNLALIESIIKQNPYILYNVTMDTYVVQLGDTLGGIAEKCGNTLKRICHLNDIDSKKTIFPGMELKVEIIKEKNELDKKIAALESYLHNYVFASPIAEAARAQKDDEKNQFVYYRAVLYGSPKKFASLDPNSYYGMFINNYMKFHELKDITDEDKKQYIDSLMNIAIELENKLNLNENIENIVPYSKYYIYLQNRTTEFDSVVDQHRTIYR